MKAIFLMLKLIQSGNFEGKILTIKEAKGWLPV